MTPRRVLVIGSGAREHALAARLAADGPEVLVAPGNDGIAAEFRCLDLLERDALGLLEACRREAVDLVVVGPEAPLAAGLADVLRQGGIAVFGPGREGARIESSKAFAKDVLWAAGVPTARAEAFASVAAARDALGRFGPPWVLKADGLAAGKGVLVTTDPAEAEGFLEECLTGSRFGDAGHQVLIEEHLAGEELSVMAVCDSDRVALLPAARDYKRAEDGDQGPNTGGMGAEASSDHLSADAAVEVERRIVRPTLAELRRRGIEYRGALYCGLMRTASGLAVIEFNARFGDPETQVILPIVRGDFAMLLAGAAEGRVDAGLVRPAAGAVVGVALVDASYPRGATGGWIRGLPALESRPHVFVRYANGRRDAGAWRVSGGRAATVCASGSTRAEARDRVYAAIATLGGEGWRFRSDIAAADAVEARTPGAAAPASHREGRLHA